MLGFAEETLGNEGAAVDAYSRSLRVDTSLFDPKVNPFAVGDAPEGAGPPRDVRAAAGRRRPSRSRTSSRARPASRRSSSTQRRPRRATVEIEEPPRTGPGRDDRSAVPSAPGRPVTRQTSGRPDDPPPPGLLRAAPGASATAPIEVAPAPAATAPDAGETPAPAPGPGSGREAGPRGAARRRCRPGACAPAGRHAQGPGSRPRRPADPPDEE